MVIISGKDKEKIFQATGLRLLVTGTWQLKQEIRPACGNTQVGDATRLNCLKPNCLIFLPARSDF